MNRFKWTHGQLPTMFEVPADHLIAMQSVYGQYAQQQEIGDHHRPVERGELLQSSKRIGLKLGRDLVGDAVGEGPGLWWHKQPREWRSE